MSILKNELMRTYDASKVTAEGIMDIAEIVDRIVKRALRERPTGKWIKHKHGFWSFVNDKGERDGWVPDYECSECGSRGWKYAETMNFCPNCGERMKGADDE